MLVRGVGTVSLSKTDLTSKAAVGKQTKNHPTSVRGDLDGNAPKGCH